MKILGVDPGCKRTGYALVELPMLRLRSYGTVGHPRGLEELIETSDVVVLEKPNLKRLYNKALARKLGELEAARRLLQLAAANLAYEELRARAAKAGKRVVAIPGFTHGDEDPPTWKQQITGYRRPSQADVRAAVRQWLGLGEFAEEDVVDALGLVLAFLQEEGALAEWPKSA